MKHHLYDILKNYAQSVSDGFSISGLLKSVALLVAAFLAPIATVIFSVMFLIFVDLITGILASLKEKQRITSSAMSRTIAKTFVYCTTIIVTYVVHKYLLVGFDFPAESIVSGFIALTEVKSILENMDRISNHTFLKDLILIFSNERERRLPPKKTRKTDKQE
jgi:phage-related holin